MISDEGKEKRYVEEQKSRHTEAQMIGALKQVEAGRKVEDVAREVGVSKHTLYAWRAKYGSMDVSHAQEAKQRLKAEMERKKVAVFLRERKQGQVTLAC